MILLAVTFIGLLAITIAAPKPEVNSITRFFDLQPANITQIRPSQKHVVTYMDETSWEKFKHEHSKTYHSVEEETYRKSVFTKNVMKIIEHNKLYKLQKKSFSLGINQFADMENWEYKKYNGFQHKKVNKAREGSLFLAPSFVVLPDSVDWRDKGYVTPIKNQGQCGSCWSFSTTGALEGQHFRKSGKLISLSEQQLVDCSGSFGNEGCNGGLMDNAFKYIKSVGGLETEEDYPYDAKQETCQFQRSKAVASDTGFTDVESGSESALQKAVATVGPVSVAIDASHQSFQMYQDGVYDEPECSSEQLDHGVLVVGYGTDQDSGKDYWLVKNSWGTSWGMQGYVKMTRNNDNQCGIASQASYPLV